MNPSALQVMVKGVSIAATVIAYNHLKLSIISGFLCKVTKTPIRTMDHAKKSSIFFAVVCFFTLIY